MTPEGRILHEIRYALGNVPDLRLWRNNTGTLLDATGRPVQFGLAKGSPDLIGVLAPHGRMVGLEVKTPTGRVRPEQVMFLATLREMGAFACVVRSVADALAALGRARAGLCE